MKTLTESIVNRILKTETQQLKKGQKWKSPGPRASKKTLKKFVQRSKVEQTLNKKGWEILIEKRHNKYLIEWKKKEKETKNRRRNKKLSV
jgi:hypothetical protein